MDIDTLKRAWRADTAGRPSASELDRITQAARTGARRYEREGRHRGVYGCTVFLLALAMLVAIGLAPGIWAGMRVAMALWEASALACLVGLWRVRTGDHPRADAPLASCVQASLRRIRREIDYQRSLSWLFWVPFGLGLVSALAWQAPLAPGQRAISLLVLGIFWIWGFVTGPRHWPRRLEPQARQLRALLEDLELTAAPNEDRARDS